MSANGSDKIKLNELALKLRTADQYFPNEEGTVYYFCEVLAKEFEIDSLESYVQLRDYSIIDDKGLGYISRQTVHLAQMHFIILLTGL